MAKKYNLQRISNKRSYSTEELAFALKVHVQTIRTWKKQGMKSIDGNSYPYLYFGYDIKDFLKKLTNKTKRKMLDNEMYCLKCRKPVIPSKTQIKDRNILIGNGKKSTIIHGLCPKCGSQVRRFDIQRTVPESVPIKNRVKNNPIIKSKVGEQIGMFD